MPIIYNNNHIVRKILDQNWLLEPQPLIRATVAASWQSAPTEVPKSKGTNIHKYPQPERTGK